MLDIFSYFFLTSFFAEKFLLPHWQFEASETPHLLNIFQTAGYSTEQSI